MPPDLPERDQALLLDMALAAKDALGFAAGMDKALIPLLPPLTDEQTPG